MTQTLTASLARSGAPVKATHTGVNAITGAFNFATIAPAASATFSLTAIIWLAKVPANCKIIDVKEYHSSGADSVLGSVGWRTRDGGSVSYSAFIAEITKATHSTMNVGGEGWKQLSAVSGTAFTYIVGKYLTTTKTVSLNATYSVLYTTDNEET